jgi:hypothetical protein
LYNVPFANCGGGGKGLDLKPVAQVGVDLGVESTIQPYIAPYNLGRNYVHFYCSYCSDLHELRTSPDSLRHNLLLGHLHLVSLMHADSMLPMKQCEHDTRGLVLDRYEAESGHPNPSHGPITDTTMTAPSPSSSFPTTTSTSTNTTSIPYLSAEQLKRKSRSQRVCQPCRLRKVKCTYETPCRTCIERGHPELCHYLPEVSSKRARAGKSPPPRADLHDHAIEPDDPRLSSSMLQSQLNERISSIEEQLKQMNKSLNQIQASLAQTSHIQVISGQQESEAASSASASVKGISATDELTGNTIYLGENSVPAMVVALAEDDDGEAGSVEKVLNKSIVPMFGLTNESAVYPFVDLWGIPHGSFKRLQLLCRIIPNNDLECIQTFKHYRDTAHVIFPGIANVAQFESELLDFLRFRKRGELTPEPGPFANQTVYGRDIHWLGLLFAALASGVQCSDISRKERQMKSQVYGTKMMTLLIPVII